MPYSVPLPVEPALEANEAAAAEEAAAATDDIAELATARVMTIPSNTVLQEPSRRQHLSQVEAKREFVRSLQIENFDLELRVKDAATILSGNKERCHSVPSTSTAGSKHNTPTRKHRYEIPDDLMTRTAVKILANRKELEMHEFIAARLQRNTNNINIPSDRDDVSRMPIVDPSGERHSPPNDI